MIKEFFDLLSDLYHKFPPEEGGARARELLGAISDAVTHRPIREHITDCNHHATRFNGDILVIEESHFTFYDPEFRFIPEL